MAQGFPQGLKQKQQELLAEVQAGRMTPDEAAHALASLANPNFAENFAPRSDRRGMDSRPPQGLTGQGGDDGMSFTENQRVRSPAQGLMGAQTPTPVAPEQQLPPRPQPQVAPQPAPGLLDQGSGMPASEVQARDAQIMSPDYNNQGVQGFKPQVAPQPAPGLLDQGALPSADVNMNMQKQFRPSQLGQTPMAMNVDTPMQGNPYGQGEAAAPGPARDVGAEGVVPGGTAYAGLMGREKPGPMNIFGGQGGGSSAPQLPQGQEEPSIFSRLGGGLKSMGKGMSNYTKELFNDPSRMAMLQGGLSMMDPNSYYDKQGFGSVFTGMNKGLGAAQGGMQGVLDRRKSLADIQKTKAEATIAKTGGARGEHEKILNDLRNPNLPAAERKHKLARLKMIEQGPTPALIQELDAMSALTPEAKAEARAWKRAAVPTVDFGGKVGIRDAIDPDNPNAMKFIEKTLEKHQEPTYLQDAEFFKATGKTIGVAQAHAKTTLGVSQQSADYMLKTLDDAASHPGMAGVIGVPNLLGYLPGSDEAGFKTLYDQLKGKTFLQAYETLKGGGQITEVEGQKGEAALARLGTAQKEEEFLVALQDFKDVVRDLLEEQVRQSNGEFGGYITRAKRAKDAKAKAGKSNKLTPEEDAELKALELKFGGK